MHLEIVKKLIELNQQFYQTFALQFSATRERLQPGVAQVLESIPPKANILDLGCGNGELSQNLVERDHEGQYIGVDFSAELLEVANAGSANSPNVSFVRADLSIPDWISPFTIQKSQFDIILAFAALHHLPSRELHLKTLRNIHTVLTPAGRFIHSNWQFLNSPRLKTRIQPWEKIGLIVDQVDSGDYLLDWRRGGYGLRYVHHFSEDELNTLAQESNFIITKSFYSDGQEGNLGLYQVWEKA